MKVFELMNALGELSAGAEVRMCKLVSVSELEKNSVATTENGINYYEVCTPVLEAEEDDDVRVVYLYG